MGASPSVGASATLGGGRVFACVLNALTKRITLRPELLCENFVNNRDLGTGLGRLCFGKHATSNHWQSNGRKIIRPDAVPGRLEGKAICGGRRLGVWTGMKTGTLDFSG